MKGIVLWKGVLTFATPEKIPLVTVLSISLRYTSFTNVAFLSSVRTVNRHSPNSHQWVQQIFPSRYRRKKGHFLKWDSLSTRWVIELPLKLGNSSRAGVRGSCYSLFFAAVFLFSSNFSLFSWTRFYIFIDSGEKSVFVYRKHTILHSLNRRS